jgi:hypothetical protein
MQPLESLQVLPPPPSYNPSYSEIFPIPVPEPPPSVNSDEGLPPMSSPTQREDPPRLQEQPISTTPSSHVEIGQVTALQNMEPKEATDTSALTRRILMAMIVLSLCLLVVLLTVLVTGILLRENEEKTTYSDGNTPLHAPSTFMPLKDENTHTSKGVRGPPN